MTDKTGFVEGFEFDEMARRPLYRLCPAWLVDHCGVRSDSTVVDLGCGSGIVTQLLLDRLGPEPGFRIFAVDPSAAELKIARARIADPRVTFVQGRAQELGTLIKNADVIVLCNVLHQIPIEERGEICAACLGLLTAGGSLGLSTLFYGGGIPPETRMFYRQWIQQARAWLRQRGLRLRPPTTKPVALQLLSAAEHLDMLTRAGFVSVVIEEPILHWRLDDWAALSRYSVFIRGSLGPDVPLDVGSAALIAGAAAAFDELRLDSVPRAWLHLAGRKPD